MIAIALTWLTTEPKFVQNVEVDFGSSRYLVSTQDIVAVRAARNYLDVYMCGKSTPGIIRTTLKRFHASTAPHLLQTHRSWLVDPSRISGIKALTRGRCELELPNDLRAPVSARFREQVLQLDGLSRQP